MVGKVNVGVVGVESWGKNHARVFSDLRSDRLVGVCDIDSNRVTEIAKTYETALYARLQNLLENGDIEALSICTPTTTHYNIAPRSLSMENMFSLRSLWSVHPKKWDD